MSSLPRLVVTGASGFVGRHLLDVLKEHHHIVGLARRTQAKSGAPVHPNIEWHQLDVGDRDAVFSVFRRIREGGGASVLLHLAAHYDFTGDEHPEYWRTNVEGLRNVLDASAGLGLRRFVFSSSVAACRLPSPGRVVDETSPADGEHVYARTKAAGERMLAERRAALPSNVVRFAALFSDWCEYAPLYMFLETWLGTGWNRSVLGGHGRSAIPYLHVSDLTLFVCRLLRQLDRVAPGALLVASPDGAVSHRQLFEAATLEHDGRRRRPLLIPRPLCGPGMWARDVLGRVTGERPFERPWMARYIDEAMTIDASRTRELLGWSPRLRLAVLRRLPFLLENRKTEPEDWHRLNRAAFKHVEPRPHLRVHRLLVRHEDAIAEALTTFLLGNGVRDRFPSYRALSPEEHRWNHRLILRHLMTAVRTHDRGVFVAYCRDLARRRFEQGFGAQEVCDVLRELNRICFKVIRRDPESDQLRETMIDSITMTLRFGCDQAQDVLEQLESEASDRPTAAGSAR